MFYTVPGFKLLNQRLVSFMIFLRKGLLLFTTTQSIYKNLELRGYLVKEGKPKPPWKGYTKSRQHTPLFAERDGVKYYITKAPRVRSVIKKLIFMQDEIPHMARINELVNDYLVTEYIDGVTLWDIEKSLRPSLSQVKMMLSEITQSLAKASIIHGDLRPWNILYCVKKRKFYVIDWGFSCFIPNLIGFPRVPTRVKRHFWDCGHKKPFKFIDIDDSLRFIELLKQPRKLSELWPVSKGSNWYPDPWCD
jgi:serine/threonine protein kinase